MTSDRFTSTFVDQPFDPAKLEHIKRALTDKSNNPLSGWRQDERAEAFLRSVGAKAGYMPIEGMPGIIYYPPTPGRVSTTEELLHLGQHRRLGFPSVNPEVNPGLQQLLEISAQKRLIKIGERLSWSIEEITFLEGQLAKWENDLVQQLADIKQKPSSKELVTRYNYWKQLIDRKWKG